MTFRIGVVGLGWSGSGAVIDLLKRKVDSAGYPIEYDFFRKPSGLLECGSTSEIRKFCFRQIFTASNRLLKALAKLVVSPKHWTTFCTSISVSCSDIFCSSSILACSILISDSNILINKYVNLNLRLYRKRAPVFYFDQPVFPEQIHQKSINCLSLDALIVVTRDVRDQVIEWQENGNYLSPKTIREQFFVGGQFDEEKSISNSQILAMLHTLKQRIQFLENLTEGSPIAIQYIRFEDLILNSKTTVDALNRYFLSNGAAENLIDCQGLDELFRESHNNIAKYRKTEEFDSSISEVVQEVNDSLNNLTRGND